MTSQILNIKLNKEQKKLIFTSEFDPCIVVYDLNYIHFDYKNKNQKLKYLDVNQLMMRKEIKQLKKNIQDIDSQDKKSLQLKYVIG